MIIASLAVRPAPASGYTGLGDVVSVDAFWGLRAYSAATCGTACVNVRRSSDNATQDILSLSTGALDVASAATFAGGGTLFVAELYEAVNGFHLTQATAADQPVLNLTGGPSGGPYIGASAGQWLAYASAISGATSTAVLNGVAKVAGSTGQPNGNFWASYGDSAFQYGFNTSTQIGAGNGASVFLGSLTASAWYASAAMFGSGSAGLVAANATSATGNTGSNSVGASGLACGYYSGSARQGFNLSEGFYCKTGAGSFAYATAIANQRAFWGI